MTVKHPSYLKISQINTIIESLLTFNNVDPYTYHRSDEPFAKPPRAKRPKNIVSKETVENPENLREEVAEDEIIEYDVEVATVENQENLNVEGAVFDVIDNDELVLNAAVEAENLAEYEVAIPFSNF